MLPQQFWRDIEGIVIDGGFRVGELLRAERDGLFVAEPLDPRAYDCPLAVRFMRVNSEPVLERYLEAAYFQQPNLLRCFGAGTCEVAGSQFVFALLERPDTTLAEIESERPLSVEEARRLGQQIITALSWLHENGLIYCNLDPANIFRVGDTWKLGEFSQLRVSGNDYTSETRRLLAISPGTPPEAWDGIVSPAWDAWSLAWVLCGAVEERRGGSRETAAGRSPTRRRFSQPFANLIPECLNANAAERCGLARIGEIIQSTPASARPIPPVENRPSDPVIDITPPEPRRRRRRLRFSPRRALMAGAVFIGVIVVASLMFRPRSASSAAVVIPVTAPAPVRSAVAPPAPHPAGEADRAAVAVDPNSPAGLVDRWAEALRSGNIDAQVACYAPNVYAFYGTSGVTPDQVRQRRQEDLARFGDARHLDISNVDVQMRSSSSAVVTFDESWDFRGHGTTTGRVKERLGMHRGHDGWHITSESNVHTYYKNGQNPLS